MKKKRFCVMYSNSPREEQIMSLQTDNLKQAIDKRVKLLNHYHIVDIFDRVQGCDLTLNEIETGEVMGA